MSVPRKIEIERKFQSADPCYVCEVTTSKGWFSYNADYETVRVCATCIPKHTTDVHSRQYGEDRVPWGQFCDVCGLLSNNYYNPDLWETDGPPVGWPVSDEGQPVDVVCVQCSNDLAIDYDDVDDDVDE